MVPRRTSRFSVSKLATALAASRLVVLCAQHVRHVSSGPSLSSGNMLVECDRREHDTPSITRHQARRCDIGGLTAEAS